MSAEIKLSMNFRYLVIDPVTRRIIEKCNTLKAAMDFCRINEINAIITL